MRYRTDLAIENQELLEEARAQAVGYVKKQRQIDEDISVTEIIITSQEGEKAFGKPRGNYITIEARGISEQKEKTQKNSRLIQESKKILKQRKVD